MTSLDVSITKPLFGADYINDVLLTQRYQLFLFPFKRFASKSFCIRALFAFVQRGQFGQNMINCC